MKILIIGASGGLAQILIQILKSSEADVQILGIDNRSTENLFRAPGIEYIQMKYTRGNFENLFRHHEFNTVYHLARQTHTSHTNSIINQRMDFAMLGTARILELCELNGVQNLIFLSTFHVYGALSDNPVFINENAPLRASLQFPELRDVVEMDQLCEAWMWKNQGKIKTVLLRPCNIIGTQVNNTMTRYLSGPISISPMDYAPHFQFLHEFDMANILYRSIKELTTGIYNIAADDFVSLEEAFKITKTKPLPIPMSMAAILNYALKRVKLDLPDYLISYLRYSCLISNGPIKKALGENFLRFSTRDALGAIRLK